MPGRTGMLWGPCWLWGWHCGNWGKKCSCSMKAGFPPGYRFLPALNEITRHLAPDLECDTAVVLDCEDMTCVGTASDFIGQLPTVINIDHHHENTGFGDLRLVDIQACGAAEIVFHIIKKLSVEMDRSIALSVYTGIVTDTGSFRFENTNAAAFSISAELLAAGVQPDQVALHLYGSTSLDHIRILSRAVEIH